MNIKKICELIDKRKEELYELLSDLIKVNSESFISYGNEKELALRIHEMCLELGLESEVYSPLDLEGFESHPDYLPGRGLENRFNTTARWRGEEDIDELMETLTYYAGDTEVCFVQGKQKMLCSQKVKINKALMAELYSFLPETCIKLV